MLESRTFARALADLKGSPVVLVFHPPHWDPARAEHIESYNALALSVPGFAGARLKSISAAGSWRTLEFDDRTLSIPLITDMGDDIASLYGVVGMSAVFVLDATGTIAWRYVNDGTALPPPSRIAAALVAAASSSAGSSSPTWSRRQFIATIVGAALALGFGSRAARAAPAADVAHATHALAHVVLNVNGREVALDIESRVTLLDALRDYAGLTGTKKGCDHGQCGACTVHVDGRRVLSCLTFAMMAEGQKITTIEGLAATADGAQGELHPLQQAFIKHDGFQCGYCTPGQLMSAAAVVKEPWGPADDDVREAMSGNICRCGAYPGIVAAVQEVRGNEKR